MVLKSLHGKLSAILFGLLCLSGCLSILLTLSMAQRYQQEVAQTINRPLAASLALHLAQKNLLSEDPAVLRKAREEIKYLMTINPNIDVYLLDLNGDVLAYSGARDAVRHNRVSIDPMRQFIGGSSSLPILGDDPRAGPGSRVFSAAAFPSGKQRSSQRRLGYVYVILGGEHYSSLVALLGRSYILRSGVWGLSIVLALVLLAGLLLFRLLTRRLRHLTAAMEAFQEQGYRNPPPAALASDFFTRGAGAASSADEIDRLGTVYLQMAKRIQHHIEDLDQADSYRREMVSNVSHDLRTPLAALHGYLETLLMKEGALTLDEQRGYLQAALRYSERLAKLVGELFELARLDSREVDVHRELFSLEELVQDVVQQHRMTAEQKGILLEAVRSDNLPFVNADIGLIERVLHNLLENALRYTPGGGSVVVRLVPEGKHVSVVVTDTGSGIPTEHLGRIFERFFRVPDQPEKPGCAGLGLAIAKRILELHGCDIAVESVVDQGTSFTFQLPIAD